MTDPTLIERLRKAMDECDAHATAHTRDGEDALAMAWISRKMAYEYVLEWLEGKRDV